MGMVLVVDDSLDTCRLLSAFLVRGGHQSVYATSVPGAMLKLIDPDRPLPDVVITDLMMPGQSGVDLIREIRSDRRTRHLPVIVYSAVDEHRHVEAAMNAGASDYWLKGSISPVDLEIRLAAFLPHGVGWATPVRDDPVHTSW